MAGRPLYSTCCEAPVVALIDVTVHPRVLAVGGRPVAGPLEDSLARIRADAAEGPVDLRGSYCRECGEAVDVYALAAAGP